MERKKNRKEKHVCEYCGTTFEARSGAKYCSASCRNLASIARKKMSAQDKKTAEAVKGAFFDAQTPETRSIGTIQQPMTYEEARARLKSFLIAAGLVGLVNAIMTPTRKSSR